MLEPFLGEICQYPYNFAPKYWLPCHGQIMSIIHNQALFSLLGTTFGGDGKYTFALPDLRPKDEKRNVIQLQVGDMYEGKPYMDYYIAVNGIYPPRN
jgi:microcystin-dependent protein